MSDREDGEIPRPLFDDYVGSVSTTDDAGPSHASASRDDAGHLGDGDATPPAGLPALPGQPGDASSEAGEDGLVARLDQTRSVDLTRRQRELDAAALILPEVTTTTRRRRWPGARRRRRAAMTRAQSEALDLVGRIRRRVPSPSLIAVASTKGGVGKTTSTLLLGHTLSAVRDDRAVALDANPDAGSLARRIQRTSTANAIDLLDLVGSVKDYYDLRHFTTMTPSGLEVIAAADDPRDTRGVSAVDTDELLNRLRAWYPLVLADCGTGTLTPSTRTILQRADALVIVTAARVDAALSVDRMLTSLAHRGLQEAVARAVVVVNAVHPRSGVDVAAVVDHFRDRAGTAIAIPYDEELSRGGVVDVGRLRPATRHAHALLAAAVLDSLRAPEQVT